jgi:hypothetical protein
VGLAGLSSHHEFEALTRNDGNLAEGGGRGTIVRRTKNAITAHRVSTDDERLDVSVSNVMTAAPYVLARVYAHPQRRPAFGSGFSSRAYAVFERTGHSNHQPEPIVDCALIARRTFVSPISPGNA